MAKKKSKPGDPETARTAESADATPGFESSLARLEKIVTDLESGQLSLTDSIQRYEQGVGILRQCHTALDQVQQKIELLTSVNEQGQARTRPFAAASDPPNADPETESGTDPDHDVDGESRLF